MLAKIASVVFLACLLLPNIGCKGITSGEQSWYKPPNIVTRADLSPSNTAAALPIGVRTPETYMTGLGLFKPINENVTLINPWQYSIQVPIRSVDAAGNITVTMKDLCLYHEILRLEQLGLPDDMTQARMYRNMLQDAIIGVSNTVGSAHVAKILGVEDSLNLTTGFLDLLFDGIAVMVTPAGTKTIFAGLSGVAGATRSLINEEVYSNIIAPAIIKAIDAERTDAWKEIVQNRTKDVRDYNVEQAIADAIAYHEAWSFYGGMQRIAKAAQQRLLEDTESTQQQIDRILGNESPASRISGLQADIAKLPAATQNQIYTVAGTAIGQATFRAGAAPITDLASFDAAKVNTNDPSNLQTMADRLEAAYNLHRP